jgi:hypothetical protein
MPGSLAAAGINAKYYRGTAFVASHRTPGDAADRLHRLEELFH